MYLVFLYGFPRPTLFSIQLKGQTQNPFVRVCMTHECFAAENDIRMKID